MKPMALPVFAEVEVSTSIVAAPPLPLACGQIGIELPTGVKLTVDAAVDADALAQVMSVLGQ